MSLLEAEKKAAEREKTISNESVKLTANYVNTVAGGVFTVGGLAPIFAALYAPTHPVVPMWAIILISLVCWGASAALHRAARRYLKEIQ